MVVHDRAGEASEDPPERKREPHEIPVPPRGGAIQTRDAEVRQRSGHRAEEPAERRESQRPPGNLLKLRVIEHLDRCARHESRGDDAEDQAVGAADVEAVCPYAADDDRVPDGDAEADEQGEGEIHGSGYGFTPACCSICIVIESCGMRTSISDRPLVAFAVVSAASSSVIVRTVAPQPPKTSVSFA